MNMKNSFVRILCLCIAVTMIFTALPSFGVSAADEIWQVSGALTANRAAQMFNGITITSAEDNALTGGGVTVDNVKFANSFAASANGKVEKDDSGTITMTGSAYKIETERSGNIAVAMKINSGKSVNVKRASDFENYILQYTNTGENETRFISFDIIAGETYYFWGVGTKPYIYGATFTEANSVSVNAGKTVKIKANPNSNALIGNVRIDDENVILTHGEGMRESTFTMPANHVTVNVDFVNGAVVGEVESLSFDLIKGNNTSENKVYENLDLFDGRQTSIGYADVSWQSSDENIISVSGEVNPDTIDTQVDFTGVFTYQDYPNIFLYKTFRLTVPADNNDEEAVLAAKEALTLGDTSAVRNNLELPLMGRRNTTITWSSSNPSVVSADGSVNPKFEEDATVILTAAITRGNASVTKEFTVTVPGIVPIRFERAAISNQDGDVVIAPSDGDYLSHIVYTNSINNLTGNEVIVAAVTNAGTVTEHEFNIKEYCEKTECQNGGETIIYIDSDVLPVSADSVITITAYEDGDKTAPLPQGTYTYAPTIAENPTIYVAGDSTACTYASTGSNNRFPQTGWAAVLGDYFSGAAVNDLALSGRSSLSFLKDANYTTIKNNIKAGDYFIIQFGHNDSKAGEADRYTDPTGDRFTDGSFKKNLVDNYVNIALDKGAYPLLTTSISRRSLSDASLEEYVNATKELGHELGLPVIDLYAKTNGYINRVGTEKAKDIFNWIKIKDSRFVNCMAGDFKNSQYYNKEDSLNPGHTVVDNTHLNYYGAQIIAQWFCDELSRISHPLTGRRNDFTMSESDVPSYADATAAVNLKLSLMSADDEYVVIYNYDSSLGTVEISVEEDSADMPPEIDTTPKSYSIQYADGAAIVAAPKAGTYTVIFAAYRGGALTSVEWKSVTFNEAGETTVTPDASNDDADSIKVMLWNSINDMYPLCASIEKSQEA